MVTLIRAPHQTRRLALGQRSLDIVVASVCLVLFGPLMLFIVAIIRLDSRGKAMFHQQRIGLAYQEFTLIKFRTMFVDNDDSEHREQNRQELLGASNQFADEMYKDPNDNRITRVGGFLRRYSLDELPQLINVLHGTMSIVGPRPSMTWEVELFPASARDRFSVNPGITGIWQVAGRNNVSMPEMLEMDCEYALNRTIRQDLGIMVRTVPAALSAEGAA